MCPAPSSSDIHGIHCVKFFPQRVKLLNGLAPGYQLDSSRLFSIRMPSWYHLSTVTGILGVEQSGLVIGSSIRFTSWIVISPVFPDHVPRKQLWPEAEWEDYSLHLPLTAIFLELGGKSSWLLTLLLFLIVHSFAKTWQDSLELDMLRLKPLLWNLPSVWLG